MAKALHVLLIFLASVLVGLWGRGLLLDVGLFGDFDTAMTVAIFLAAAYATAQYAFHGLVLFLKPTRSTGVVIAEALAQLSALALVPSLLGVALPLPAAAASLPALVMPLLFFGVFVALHLLFKLMFFFAAVQGVPAPRREGLFWLFPTGAALFALIVSAVTYLASVEQVSIMEAREPVPVIVGEVPLSGWMLSENRALPMTLSCKRGQIVSLLFADTGELDSDEGSLYIRVRAYGQPVSAGRAAFEHSPTGVTRYRLRLIEGAWAPLTFDCALLPADTQSILVDWSDQDPGDWKRRLGMKKRQASSRSLWVAEPLIQ